MNEKSFDYLVKQIYKLAPVPFRHIFYTSVITVLIHVFFHSLRGEIISLWGEIITVWTYFGGVALIFGTISFLSGREEKVLFLYLRAIEHYLANPQGFSKTPQDNSMPLFLMKIKNVIRLFIIYLPFFYYNSPHLLMVILTGVSFVLTGFMVYNGLACNYRGRYFRNNLNVIIENLEKS